MLRSRFPLARVLPAIAPLALVPAASAEPPDAEAISAIPEPRPIGADPHPYTTDQGRFIIEFTPLGYAYDRHNTERANRRVDAFEVGVLFKYGLLENLDLQIGADALVREREHDHDADERSTMSGFGDLTLRAKYNVWGNDGGETALALMPYIVFPTSTGGVGDRGVRGGLIIPTLWQPLDGWTIEIAPALSSVRNSEDDGYVFEFAGLLTLTYEFSESAELYTDFEASMTSESGEPWAGDIGVGAVFYAGDDLSIDLSVHFGVTRSAPDVSVFLTLVKRF